VVADHVGDHHPAIAVNLRRFAGAEQRNGQGIVIRRQLGKRVEAGLNFAEEFVAARIDGGAMGRGDAIEAFKAVSRQDRTEGCRDRHTTLGIQPVGKMRHKTGHNTPLSRQNCLAKPKFSP
jgi:hypothetical protein